MEERGFLGLMSGTSLDGVDLAYCTFSKHSGNWEFSIAAAETIPYDERWRTRLASAMLLDGLSLTKLHVEYGTYLAKISTAFVEKNNLPAPLAVCSHGHTIFHNPKEHYTLQIGSGAAIAAQSGFSCICDFRTSDVALGGEGAPLVPIGDMLLFSQYGFAINLGGIANVSFERKKRRIAFDICPANMALNPIADLLGKAFDDGGAFARKGVLNDDLLLKLNSLDFYTLNPPKSLGKEWFDTHVWPLLSFYKEKISPGDLLRTVVEHISEQIAAVVNKEDNASAGTVLLTGGGARNTFLVERISAKCMASVVVPDDKIIDYKEALIFAFLGYLRLNELPNCLASVTGAVKDTIGGAIYLP